MTMSAKAIRIYKILKARDFSDEDAQEVVDFMESSGKEGLATREDVNALKSEIKSDFADLRLELIRWIIGVGIAGFTAQVALLKLLKVI